MFEHKDNYNLSITTSNCETVTLYNFFVEQVLSYGNQMNIIFEAADNDSRCCLVNSLASIVHSFAETNYNHCELANKYYQNVMNSTLRESCSPREKKYIELAGSLIRGDQTNALQLFEEIVERWPQDLLASKLLQIQYFNHGKKEDLKRIGEKSLKYNINNNYAYGMAAFGFVECEEYELAERYGRRAVQMSNGNDPWAQHAVAHCLDMQGKMDEGIQWMEAHSSTWDNCCAFMYTHNWWHVALFYLDKDDFSHVMRLYDQCIWNKYKDDVQCQAGAISLLWRLDTRKVPASPSHWEDLSCHVRPHVYDHMQPFLDLHYIYTMARAGEDEKVQDMFEGFESSSKYSGTQLEVTKRCAKAVVHYARGDYEQSCQEISQIYSQLHTIGGSNAQRDLFSLTYIDSLIQTQRYGDALKLLQPRQKQRPNTMYIKRDILQCTQHILQAV